MAYPPAEPLDRPRLVVLTGRPGSGKSTLGPLLADALRYPLISRDAIKEGLVGTPDNERANAAFFETIRLFARCQVNLIAEAAFQHAVWSTRLNDLGSLAEIRIVVCTVPHALAQRRHEARALADPERGRFHDVGPLPEAYEPPRLGFPTLTVDTAVGYRPTFDQIVAFARGEL